MKNKMNSKAASKKVVVVKTKPAPKKTVVKAKSSPKTEKPVRTIGLPEVSVTATRLKKYNPQVKLTPSGMASKKSVDSLRSIYGERVIPKEIRRREGEVPFMGADASDRVKKLLKKK